MRRAALALPPIRQLHSDYHGALLDCKSAQSENERLQHEITMLHDMEAAVSLIDQTHETERNRFAELLAGLQYTADTLTSENAEYIEAIRTLEDELKAAKVVEAALASEHSELKKQSVSMANELNSATNEALTAKHQHSELQKAHEVALAEIVRTQTLLKDAAKQATNLEIINSAIHSLKESSNQINQKLEASTGNARDSDKRLLGQVESLNDDLREISDSLSQRLESIGNAIAASGDTTTKQLDILLNETTKNGSSALQMLKALQLSTGKIGEGIQAKLETDLIALGGNLDNLTASTATNLDKLSTSVHSYIEGLSSVQESTGLIQRSRLDQLLRAFGEFDASNTERKPINATHPIADHWLDLLESVLTGTVTEDAPMSPWSGDDFDPSVRIIGRDWPKTAYTMIGTARMRNMRALTERVITEDTAGDILEAGTWRGGTCIYMKAILRAYSQEHRRVFVADSFRGLPKPDAEKYEADAGDEHHIWKQLAASKQDVMANFRRFNLLDDGVVFLEGWFKDTLPSAPVEELAILRLDGDMYESTMDTLTALYHKVTPGGFVVIDDYLLPACRKAVSEFRSANEISDTIHEVDGAAVYWQVT